MNLQRQSDKSLINIEPKLQIGAGGEARIYAIRNDLSLVAKIYHEVSEEKSSKLSIMINNAPVDPMAYLGHVSIAWPSDLLINNGNIIGFLMPRVIGMQTIIDFYNPGARRKNCPLFSYQYLYRTARNLSAVFRALHESGYVIGDVNESNIFVSQTSLVTIVDTDSFQVYDTKNDIIYRCTVGRPEFTPPELQDGHFRNIDRKPENDLFGLAVLIFMLLMEGTHPFSGIYLGKDEPPLYGERILSGHFIYSTKRRVPYRPPKSSPPFELIDPLLRELFVLCFEEGHSDPKKRPDAKTWQDALEDAEKRLITCKINDQHKYSNHLKSCPWCKRANELKGLDPFPSVESVRNGSHLPKENKTNTTRTIQPRQSLIVAHPSLFKRYATRPIKKYNWKRDIRIWLSIAFVITLLLSFGPNALQIRVPLNQAKLSLTLTGHNDIVTSVASSPSGDIIASGSRDGTIRLWNTETGDLIKTISIKGNFINSVAFSPNGNSIAVAEGWVGMYGGIGGEASIWDINTGKSVKTFSGHDGVVLSVAFSPDGKLLATTGMDDTLRLWDSQTGEVKHILKGHSGDVTSVAFSSNGNFIATASTDNSARIWSVNTGKMLKILSRRYYTPMTSVAFSSSNMILVSGCYDNTARVWDLTTGGLQNIMIGHKGPVNSVALTSDGGLLATGSSDNTIRLWSMARNSYQILKGHEGSVTSIAITPNMEKLISASKDKTIKIWDIRNYAYFK